MEIEEEGIDSTSPTLQKKSYDANNISSEKDGGVIQNIEEPYVEKEGNSYSRKFKALQEDSTTEEDSSDEEIEENTIDLEKCVVPRR